MESSSEAAIARLTQQRGPFLTCWAQLGLPSSADVLHVTKAYRRLSLLVHPDKAGADLADQAHEAFQNLSLAFQQALKFAQARGPPSAGQSSGGAGGDNEGATGSAGRGRSDHGPACGKEWWKHKKPWEIDEMMRQLEEEYRSELAAGQERAAVRRERRAQRQQERHAEVAELQEEWFADAEPAAEAKRSSWQAFVTSGRTKTKRRKTTGL